MIELVAFLGNYGREYEKTRHNVSWFFEDSLPFANKLSWQSKFKCWNDFILGRVNNGYIQRNNLCNTII